MSESRLYRILKRVTDIRPDECRAAAAFFLHFFLVTFAFYIIKAVKENFQIGVNERWWGYFDLGTAVLIGFVVALNARLLRRLSRRSYLARTVVFFIASLLFFALVFHLLDPATRTFFLAGLFVFVRYHPIAFVFLFSFWADIFIALSVTQFWISVNDILNPHQAKRLVGFLVTGGLLGGIAGSLLTTALSAGIGPARLLLFCPAALLLILAVVRVEQDERDKVRVEAEAGPGGRGLKTGYLESFRTVRRDRYLRILAGVLASAMIVGQFINYQFKFIVKAQGWSDGVRTSFLATFFLAILVISTVLHLATTGQILRRFGIRLALLVAPTVLLVGSLAVFAMPVAALMAWACVIRGSDKTFDNTISQSVRELLYIPVAADIKYQAKIFIDMFVNKFALGFGAVIYWVVYRVSSFAYKTTEVRVRELGIFAIGFTLVWIVLILIIYAEYLGVVKRDLLRKWQDAQGVVKRHVDMDATRLIFDTIQSREKSSTLYVMNLFQLVEREKLTPELMEILDLKEGELKARSMDALLDVGGEAFFQGVGETLSDKDFGVQVREIMGLDEFKQVMGKRLAEITAKRSAPEVERMEAARLVGGMEPSADVFAALGRLLQDPSPDVLNYALGSAAVHLRKEHVPLIIRHLGNPMTREVAQAALEAYGPRIEDTLRKHLQDRGERPEVRKAIPEVLARFASQKTADILTAQLSQGEEEIEQEIVDALYKIRSGRPDIVFGMDRVRSAILALLRKNYERLLTADPITVAGPEVQAAVGLGVKRIFDLLALVHPAEDIVRAYQNILQGSKKSGDYSLELLDNLLDRDLKTWLLPLIEDLPAEERLRRLRRLARGLGVAEGRERG